MGWCTEFAHRIERHCDEPMVAGTASCSCATCGVVCTGKFSVCANVWAQREQPVALLLHAPDRPTSNAAAEPSRDGPRETNGVTPKVAPALTRVSSSHAEAKVVSGNGTLGRELLAELSMITQRMEQASSVLGTANPSQRPDLAELVTQLQRLPEQIARALSAALRQQHELIVKDVRIALEEYIRGARPSEFGQG